MNDNFKSLSKGCLLVFVLLTVIFSCASEETGTITGPPEEEEVTDTTDTIDTTVTTITPPIEFPEPTEIVTTTLYGQVLGEDDNPLEGAQIICKSCSPLIMSTTDAEGNFLMQDVENKGSSAFITVEYRDMFKGYRRMGVLENRFNYTQVKMKRREIIGQIDSELGGTLELASGATLTLSSDAVVNATGTAYNGPIDVYAAWINPESADLNQNMIGNLSGIDQNSAVQALSTYGMLTVELTDPLNNELSIADTTEAFLQFPVPESMLENAPNTIPLWSYNEEEGYWVEEGRAELIDGFYKGQVTHFSSWNVDTKGDAIDLSGQIYVRAGNSEITPAYFQVLVTGATIGQRGGWLCEDGSFLFSAFPAEEPFLLQVIDYCGQLVYEQTYDGFSSDESLDDIIIIGGPDLELHNISGSGIDCDMNPLANGLVKLVINDKTFLFPTDNGAFDYFVSVCSEFEATLEVYDSDNLLGSEKILFSNLDGSYEFYDVLVCGDIENYIQYSIDGEQVGFSVENFYVSHFIDKSGLLRSNNLHYNDVVNNEALLNMNLGLDIVENEIRYTANFTVKVGPGVAAEVSWGNNPDFQFVMTSFDIANKKYSGYFNGTVTDMSGKSYEVNGSFRKEE